MTLTIGLTDGRVNEAKYALYEKWLCDMFDLWVRNNGRGNGDTLRTLRLTPGDKNGALAGDCDGVVLTGGGDVDPQSYGADRTHPTLSGVSLPRDRFEFDILRRCSDSHIPLLGICRGMQLANVALGGTLIVDLEESGYRGHRSEKGGRSEHEILLGEGTALRGLLAVEGGTAVSSHHQAVGKIGRGLHVAATSPDGVIEALESDATTGRPDLLLVQWHPERTANRLEPLCGGPGIVFFQTIASKKNINGKLP